MSQSHVSWFLSQPIPIRFEGAEAIPPAKDAMNREIPGSGVPARPPWPEGVYVYIKSQVEAGDWEQVQQLKLKSQRLQARADEGAEITADLGILTESIIYTAVFVTGFEGSVFTDPQTGRTMVMPEDIQDRIKVASKLPLQVCGFIHQEVSDRILAPLPGGADDETATSSRSEPLPIRSSRTSASKGRN